MEKTRNFGDISFGSPMARSARKANTANQTDQPLNDKEPLVRDSAKETQKKVKPIKLGLATSSDELSSHMSPTKEAPVSATIPPLSATNNSRPGTPLTGISRNSDSSGPRQPRVLRVVDTPKTETPPATAVQALPSVAQTKVRSRRPSLSPARRSSTPGEVGSDYELTTSASVSRANSPPPTKIGSAPVRAMTKNQAKKERRLKAKQAEEAMKEEAAAVIPEEPVQAPIVGRKRKTKKPPAASSEPSTAAKGSHDTEGPSTQKKNVKPEPENQKAESFEKSADTVKTTSDESAAKPPSIEPWRANNTISQLIKDAENTGTAIRDLFLERTAPLHVLLAQMHNSAQLDLNSHALFNPLPLNQRNDMKCHADDYDRLRQPINLTEEHKKTLLSGQPVRVNDGSDALKDRCLITPKGRILRHLSVEEENQYLNLERDFEPGTWNEYPGMSALGPDATNLNGGLDALFLTPGRFNIRWVAEPSSPGTSLATAGAVVTAEDQYALDPPSEASPPNVLSMMEADANRSYTGTVREPHADPAVRPFAGGAVQRILDAKGTVFGDIAELDNVFGMSNKELRTYIEKSQRELESSRKEFDAFDKKLAALVKRNKKLAQQALGAAVEVGK